MGIIIDRRKTPPRPRYMTSRRRFLERNQRAIREAINKKISDSNIGDVGKGGVDVSVPKDDLISEPIIQHDENTGVKKRVHPGNKQFSQGDKIKKPRGGGGAGGSDRGEPSDSGEGDDDFSFILTEEEFLNFVYEDLGLPNLKKKTAEDLEMYEIKRKGNTSDGSPSRLDLVKSKRQQIARVVAAKRPKDKTIHEALKELFVLYGGSQEELKKLVKGRKLAKSNEALIARISSMSDEDQSFSPDEMERIEALNHVIDQAEDAKSYIPEWNDLDLVYRRFEKLPVPSSKAVMFCLMDVSGSMDEYKKSNAKLFYMLLFRFLKRNYKTVDVVFIRHTTEAEEVDEEAFFYDQKTGGTVVSTSLKKMREIIDERYPSEDWNIYGAQASDGENWGGDSKICVDVMDEMFHLLSAYFYIEVTWPDETSWGEALWGPYEAQVEKYPGQFFMGKIKEKKDIWPVFREFFKKTEEYEERSPQASAYSNFSMLRG